MRYVLQVVWEYGFLEFTVDFHWWGEGTAEEALEDLYKNKVYKGCQEVTIIDKQDIP